MGNAVGVEGESQGSTKSSKRYSSSSHSDVSGKYRSNSATSSAQPASHMLERMESQRIKMSLRPRAGSLKTVDDLEREKNESIEHERIVELLEKCQVRFRKFEQGDSKSTRKRGRDAISSESTASVASYNASDSVIKVKSAHEQGLIFGSIKKNPLFASIQDEKIRRCCDHMEACLRNEGEVVVQQGKWGDNFYVVVEGGVDIEICKTKENNEKENIIVAHMGPGGSFGELALMCNHPRTATVRATEETKLYSLSRIVYRRIILFEEAERRKEINKFFSSIRMFRWMKSRNLSKMLDLMEERHLAVGEQMASRFLKDKFVVVTKGCICNSVDDVLYPKFSWFGIASPETKQIMDQLAKSVELMDFFFGDQLSSQSTWKIFSNREMIPTMTAMDKKEESDEEGLTIRSSTGIPADSIAVSILYMNFEDVVGLFDFKFKLDCELDDLKRDYLQSNFLFSDISEASLRSICKTLILRQIKRGEVVFQEGDEGEKLYLILFGEILIEKDGKEVIRLFEGSIFGEHALLQSTKRNARCSAATDVSLFELPGEHLPEEVFDRLRKMKYVSHLNKFEKIEFSNLEVKTLLGMGTFGKVSLAIDKVTNLPYALKAIDKVVIDQLDQHEHIVNEKNIMAELDHPFITKLHATFMDERYLYLLLDLNVGGELFNRLDECETLSIEEALFYASSVISALNYLHQRKIAFRDLKPENMIFDMRGYIKLVDFGFAKTITDLTYTMCGTPDYIAPEVIQNAGHNELVDVWGVGIFLYEMLYGFTPFTEQNTARNDSQVFKNIMVQEITFPTEANKDENNLILQLCTKEAFDRPSCADVKGHACFKELNWKKLESMEIEPPFKPKLADPLDVSNFDEVENTAEDVQLERDEEWEFIQDTWDDSLFVDW